MNFGNPRQQEFFTRGLQYLAPPFALILRELDSFSAIIPAALKHRHSCLAKCVEEGSQPGEMLSLECDRISSVSHNDLYVRLPDGTYMTGLFSDYR